MSLHKDAVYIPQQLSIFKGYYQVLAGVLSLSVALVYYVVLPIIWKGQTLGKKLLGLKIVNDDYQEVNLKQLIIRQVIMIFLVEGSIYTCSNMFHQLVNVLTGYNIAAIWNKVGLVISVLSGILVIVLKSKKSLHDIVSHTLVVVDQMNQLSDLELDIYNYIISHRHEVVHMKLKDLAIDLHVSSSMISRVAKKLGYEGFLEWKAEMKLDQEDKPVQNKRALNYILDYFNRVDNKEFDDLIHQAAEMIVNSHEVICSGIGLSDAIAKFAASLFNRKGKRTIYCEDFSSRFRGMYDENDCALFFTVSGETKEVIDRIRELKRYGTKIIVITNNASSTAAKMSDLAITYYVPSSRNDDFYSSATQVPVLYIIESIANIFIEYGIY